MQQRFRRELPLHKDFNSIVREIEILDTDKMLTPCGKNQGAAAWGVSNSVITLRAVGKDKANAEIRLKAYPHLTPDAHALASWGKLCTRFAEYRWATEIFENVDSGIIANETLAVIKNRVDDALHPELKAIGNEQEWKAAQRDARDPHETTLVAIGTPGTKNYHPERLEELKRKKPLSDVELDQEWHEHCQQVEEWNRRVEDAQSKILAWRNEYASEFLSRFSAASKQSFLPGGIDQAAPVMQAQPETSRAVNEPPAKPAEPSQGSSLQIWLDYYHTMKESGFKTSFRAIAEKSGYAEGTFKNAHEGCQRDVCKRGQRK